MALKVGELYSELTIDTSRHQRGLDESRRSLTEFEQAVARAARGAGDSVDRSANGFLGLRSAVDDAARVARSGMGQVETSAQEAARRLREAEQAASGAQGSLSRLSLPSGLSNQIGNLGGALGDIGPRMGAAGAGGGASFLTEFSGKVGGLAAAGGPIAMGLAGVAALGLGAGAILAGAISDGMNQEKDLALIQAQLGVGDDTMRTIGAAASASYKAGWGESTAANAQGIRDAIEAGLLTGEELAPDMTAVSKQLQTVAAVMEEDVSAAARAAGQAVKTGLVDNPEAALDLLTKAQQAGLNVADDMLDTTTEYGTQFRQVGLSGVEAFALMNQAVKHGARDADTAADAIKEFAIRSIDGSTASAEAYAALSMNAEEMTAKIAQGGPAAREGMAEILREVNALEDPVKRNTVAVGLFGTKAEDLGEAMYSLNLDTAVQQFGEVEGAAQRAGDIIQNTTAQKIERAQRSIEVSMNGVKGSLAEAFGPSLQKVADWVSAHQPEIIGFFGNLASGALTTLDAIAGFVSGGLRAFASFHAGAVDAMGAVLGMLGSVADNIGGVIKHIPGMEGMGKALEGAGTWMQEWEGKAHQTNETLRNMADTIDNTVRPGLQGMRDTVNENTDAAVNSAEMFRALGEDVRAVPTEHGIQIFENTPDVQAKLAALGLTVKALPDGSFEVVAETAAGQTKIDDFVRTNTGKVVGITLSVNGVTGNYNYAPGSKEAIIAGFTEGYKPAPGRTSNSGTFADGGITEKYADGKLPDQATIKAPTTRLIQWAEPETGGEAFIPLSPAKRPRSLQILAETARRMGVSIVSRELANIFQGDPHSLDDRSDPTGWRALLGGDYNGKLSRFGIEEDNPLVDAVLSARKAIVDGDFDGRLTKFGIEEDSPIAAALLGLNRFVRYADGGIIGGSPVDGLVALAGQHAPALSITSTNRPGSADHHGAGKAVDFSNGSGNTDEQLAWANYLADHYQAHLRELIYDDPRFDRNIKDGKIVPRSFYAGAGDHTHHVHAAADVDLRTIDTDALKGREEQVDTRTGKERHVDEVVAEGKRRGMSDKQIKAAVMTMLAESDGVMYANASDPESLNFAHDAVGSDHDSVGLFQQRDNGAWGTTADRMDPAKSAGMFYDELAKLDEASMSEAQLAQAVQRSAFADGSNYAAKSAEADVLIAESNDRAASSSAASSGPGDAQPVYVTNWPAGFGGSSASSSSSSSSSSTPAASEPETPDPHDLSTPGGRGSLLRALQGAQFFANGGFGGFGESHDAQIASAGSWRVFAEPETGGEAYIPLSPTKRDRSLAIWAETGKRLGAFAVGSALTAASGFDADGNFTGAFSTGNTSIPGLDQVLERIVEKLQPQPIVTIENADINDPREFIADVVANGIGSVLPMLQSGI